MPWKPYPRSNVTPIKSNNTLSGVTRFSARYREEKYRLHLPGIKPIFLSRPYPSLVTTPNEISRVPRTIEAINIDVDCANPNIRTCFIIFEGHVILPPPPHETNSYRRVANPLAAHCEPSDWISQDTIRTLLIRDSVD